MKAFIAIVLLALLTACAEPPATNQITQQTAAEPAQPEPDSLVYNPVIDQAHFSADITNKYFTLTPGTAFIYEGDTEDGREHIEVYVTNQTRTVMGVQTRVVWDRVWREGELIEDTKDWYSQDSKGNVWYFGEDSVEMLDGKIVNHAGSWEAGVDGAKPGIVMQADPKEGNSYYQEYYEGIAEDKGEVLSLTETITTPYGTLSKCLKTLDINPLHPGDEEHKYYCPTVGFTVAEVGVEDGERIELIDVKKDSEPTTAPQKEPEQLKTKITEQDAVNIALREVPGQVTDVSIERKAGKPSFVVEIEPQDGRAETDVIIDMDTGEVLGVET